MSGEPGPGRKMILDCNGSTFDADLAVNAGEAPPPLVLGDENLTFNIRATRSSSSLFFSFSFSFISDPRRLWQIRVAKHTSPASEGAQPDTLPFVGTRAGNRLSRLLGYVVRLGGSGAWLGPRHNLSSFRPVHCMKKQGNVSAPCRSSSVQSISRFGLTVPVVNQLRGLAIRSLHRRCSSQAAVAIVKFNPFQYKCLYNSSPESILLSLHFAVKQVQGGIWSYGDRHVRVRLATHVDRHPCVGAGTAVSCTLDIRE